MKCIISLIFLTLSFTSYSQTDLSGFTFQVVPTDGDYLPDQIQANQARQFRDFDIPPLSEEDLRNSVNNLAASSEMDFQYNSRIKSWVTRFTGEERAYLEQMIGLSKIYFPYYEEILQLNGMPDELKYLSVIESGLNSKVTSRSGAKGLWQFMPYTGREWGLHMYADDEQRSDLILSTESACAFLADLYNRFGDWQLALAAYNCGPGCVRSAIRRSGSGDYYKASRYLPRETRNYVPKFIAFIYLMKNYENHNVYPIYPPQDLQDTEAIKIVERMTFKQIAELSGVTYEKVAFLNAQYKKKVVPASLENPRNVILPTDGMYQLKLAMTGKYSDEVYRPEYARGINYQRKFIYKREKIRYKVRNGDNLGAIAKKHRVYVKDIKKWNNLSGSLIRTGQRLWIYKTVKQEVFPVNPVAFQPSAPSIRVVEAPVVVAPKIIEILEVKKLDCETPDVVTLSNIEEIVHTVDEGETLKSILEKHKTASPETTRKINGLVAGREPEAGDQLILIVEKLKTSTDGDKTSYSESTSF